mmetsp:Transcript_21981/g.47919  ORF Transcript_21981/g.47919 Transcript_21981/m.47919 type:complete len:99 (-) Transcript_21981:18-314(-)
MCMLFTCIHIYRQGTCHARVWHVQGSVHQEEAVTALIRFRNLVDLRSGVLAAAAATGVPAWAALSITMADSGLRALALWVVHAPRRVALSYSPNTKKS